MKTSQRPCGGVGAFLIAGLLLVSAPAAAAPCPVSRAQDLLVCALKNHPDIVTAEAQGHRDTKLVEVAKQRPNPDLESRLLGGKSADDTFLNTETSFLYTLELGHKRSARIDQAGVSGNISAVEIKQIREEVALDTVRSLYRLRQIRGEIQLIEEIISTFEKILATFRSRPKLTPEQEVSRTSFQFAKEDYRLRQSALSEAQRALVFRLELATGLSATEILSHLPPPIRQWPTFPPATPPQGSNAALEKADTERSLAAAKSRVAASEAWPNLRIGPTLNTESLDSGGTRVMGGLTFAVPVPVLNRNQGEKAFAAADTLRAQTQFELTKRQAAMERDLQLRRYRAALNALRGNPSVPRLAVKHQEIEHFFEKGLVPSSLVLETHRQLFEVAKARNEMEFTGIDALWRLFILEGRYLEEQIHD